MQHIVRSFVFFFFTYIIQNYMSFFCVFLRIDSVNTALGPLGIHHSATICKFLFSRKYPETPALAFADDIFVFPFNITNPLFHENKSAQFYTHPC